MSFRWIVRNGEKVLQETHDPIHGNYGALEPKWQDVPVEKEEPKEPEYLIAVIDFPMTLKDGWADLKTIPSMDDHGVRLVDERLVEKIIDASCRTGPEFSAALEEYRKWVPKK